MQDSISILKPYECHSVNNPKVLPVQAGLILKYCEDECQKGSLTKQTNKTENISISIQKISHIK